MIETRSQLRLKHDSGSYQIQIGRGLINQPAVFAELDRYYQIVVVSDEEVAPRYLDGLTASVPKLPVASIVLPSGEVQKALQTVERICGDLISKQVGRNSVLIALGGGVVGDITGFAAACYLRGVDFVQVPTTLLAQVDSSVGGKTGVNHPLGKNMMGAFYQPQMVVADLDTLMTLPKRQVSAGIAEIIKYGLIADAEFFIWLEKNIEALRALDEKAVACAVYQSCRIKADIVAKDTKETGAYRVLLNFGHTFGHAIETSLGHKQWLHGEAVGCGMVMAAKFCAEKGQISSADFERIVALIEKAGLPIRKPDGLSAETLLELMRRDKKNVAGVQRLILLEKIGKAVACDADADELRHFLEGL